MSPYQNTPENAPYKENLPPPLTKLVSGHYHGIGGTFYIVLD